MPDFITELTKVINRDVVDSSVGPDDIKRLVIEAADNTLKAAVAGQHRDVTLSKKEAAYIMTALMVGYEKRVLKQLKPKR